MDETLFPAAQPKASPMSFGEVYNIYKDAQKSVPFFKGMSMPEFSATMMQQTGDGSFATGLEDSAIKRGSAAVNRFLKPATDVTGDVGQVAGAGLGAALHGVMGSNTPNAVEKGAMYGRQVGEGLPRGLVDFAPTIAGGALLAAPEPTGLTKVAGAGLLGLGGLAAGSGTYEQTGSAPMAGVSALANMVTPAAASLGSKAATGMLLRSPLYKVSDLGTMIPVVPTSKVAGMVERFAEYLGANVGMGAVQEGQIQAQSLINDGTTRPLDEQHVVDLVAGQLPFAAIDLPRLLRGPGSNLARSATSLEAARVHGRALAEDEVSSALKTYNKDRKALPPPPIVTDTVNVDGTPTPKQRFSNPYSMGQGSIPDRPYSGFVEVNNVSVSPEILSKVVQAQQWITNNGRQSVSPGAVARAVGLKTPEDVASVMDVLAKRGMIGDVKEDGRHAVKASVPNPREVLMEQLKYNFPKIYEKILASEAKPTGLDIMGPEIQPAVYKGQAPLPFKGEIPTKVEGMTLSPAITKALSSGKTKEEAWASAKREDSKIEWFDFDRAWRTKTPEMQFATMPGEFKFDQGRRAETRSDEELFLQQMHEVDEGLVEKGKPSIEKLIMHPHEMLMMKQDIARDLKAALVEMYTPSTKDPINLEILNRIMSFDVTTFVKGLEERGHAADEVVKMAANKMQLNVGELSAEMAAKGDQTLPPTLPKEYAEVEKLINESNGAVEKFDPGFAAEMAAHERILEDQRRQQKTTKGIDVNEGKKNRPESPWEVLARAIQDIDKYEMKGRFSPVPSDTHAFGPVHFVHAAFTKFYQDKAPKIEAFRKDHKAEVEGQSSMEVERRALYNYVMKDGRRRAGTVERKRRRQQEAAESGIAYDEAKDDLEVAQGKGQKPGSSLREQSDVDYVEKDPEGFAKEQATRGDIMAALPESFSVYGTNQLRAAMGKTKNRGVEVWNQKFNKTLQLYRDRVLEIRPSNQPGVGDTIRIPVESGIRFSDLPSLLNFDTPQGTLNFLNHEFLPAMQHMAKMSRKEIEAGRDPRKLWELPEMQFHGTGEATPLKNLRTEASEQPKPFSYVEGTERYFNAYFKSRGYGPEQTAVLTNVARKIAITFAEGDKARVAEFVTNLSWSGFNQKYNTGSGQIVGLNNANWFNQKSLNDWQAFHTLGHEFAHVSEVNKSYSRALAEAEKMDPNDRVAVSKFLFHLAVPKEFKEERFAQYVEHRADEAYHNPKEFMADLAGTFVAGLSSPAKSAQWDDFLQNGKFLPAYMQDFQRGMYANLADMMDGILPFMKAQGLETSTLSNVNTHLRDYLRTGAEVDKINDQWSFLKSNTSPDFMSRIVDAPLPLIDLDRQANIQAMSMGMKGLSASEKHLGVQPGWLEKVFVPIRQLAEKYPQLRDVANLGYEYLAMARQAQSKILEPFLTEGVLGKSTIDYKGTGVQNVLRDAKALDAFNKIALIKNEHGMDDPGFTVLDDATMRGHMTGLPKGLQDNVIAMHRALEQAAPKSAQVLINGRYTALSRYAAKAMLDAQPQLGWREAMADGEAMVNSFRTGLAADPVVMAKWGPGAITAVQVLTGMDGKGGLLARTQELEQRISNKPWWTPEVRLGRYMVAWKGGAVGFESKGEALSYAEGKEKAGTKVRVWDKTVKNEDTAGIHPLLLQSFQDIEKAGYAAAMAAHANGNTALFDQLMEAYKPGQSAWKEYLGKGFTASLLPRKLAEGRENLDVFRGFLQYVSGVTNGTARDVTKHTMALIESDPIMTANPELKQLGRDYIKTMLYPPTREMSALKKFNFLWFMGGNLSSMLLEYSQPLISVAPHFIQATGSLSKSFGGLLKTGKDLAESVFSKGSKAVSDEEQAAMTRGGKEGILDFGVLSDFFEQEDLSVVNLQKLSGGATDFVSSAGDMAKRAGYLYSHAMRSLYQNASRWNNQLTFLTGYRLAREGRITGVKNDVESAYQYAKHATPTAAYTGGPAARPVGLFANSGKFFGAVGAMYSLQSYTYTAIANMARLFQQSLPKSGLTAAETTAARKAFGSMLLGQLAMGGAMGLPLVGGLTALVEQAFGVSVKPTLEQGADAMASMFTDDEDTQNLISDVAMRGVASRLFGADLASRTSLGNVLGVDSYGGFSLETLIGPSGSVFKNLLNAGRSGVSAVMNQDAGAAADMAKAGLPRAYAGVVDLARYGDQVRDNQGRLITTSTPTEQAMMVLGFRPKRVADYQRAASMMKQAETVEAKEHSEFLQRAAKALIAGRPQEVRGMVLERAAKNGSNPRTMAQRVVEIAQELTVPYNPVDQGSSASMKTRSQIASTFATPPQRVMETQKLQQRASLEQLIGIPGGGRVSPSEMTRAQMVDRLLTMHPTISRQQATLMVEQQVHPKGQRF